MCSYREIELYAQVIYVMHNFREQSYQEFHAFLILDLLRML